MEFFCFCVGEEGWEENGREGKGWEEMEIEWRWVVGKVGFGGGQGETLAEGVGWVGRDVTEMGEGMA